MNNRSRLLTGLALVGLSLAANAVPIHWSPTRLDPNKWSSMNSVILVNGTNATRTYQFEPKYLAQYHDPGMGTIYWEVDRTTSFSSYYMTLPPNTFCKLDEGVVRPRGPVKPSSTYQPWLHPVFLLDSDRAQSIMKDVTEVNDFIYNGARVGSGISSCTAMKENWCASGKWGSWTVGVANLGGKPLQEGDAYLKQFTTYFLPDNSWGSFSEIQLGTAWFKKNLALILYQGTTNGDGFTPVYHNFAHAQSCSKFVPKH